jgi:hypothetical protein
MTANSPGSTAKLELRVGQSVTEVEQRRAHWGMAFALGYVRAALQSIDANST